MLSGLIFVGYDYWDESVVESAMIRVVMIISDAYLKMCISGDETNDEPLILRLLLLIRMMMGGLCSDQDESKQQIRRVNIVNFKMARGDDDQQVDYCLFIIQNAADDGDDASPPLVSSSLPYPNVELVLKSSRGKKRADTM